MAQLAAALSEAKAAEKEVKADAAATLKEGRAAQQALAAVEAAAEKAVRCLLLLRGPGPPVVALLCGAAGRGTAGNGA